MDSLISIMFTFDRYNLEKLRLALAPLLTPEQQRQMQFILNGYTDQFKSDYMKIFTQKLGINQDHKKANYLVVSKLEYLLDHLTKNDVQANIFFTNLCYQK